MRLIDADSLRVHHGVDVGRNFGELRAVVFKRNIDNAPTIDAVPVVHGKWEVKGQDLYCSVCGMESAYNWFGASKFSNYCPNCGARMEGKDDSN